MLKWECMINFRDKKITIMGLGLLGRGVGDAEFLVREGADLLVTDLKTRTELRESLNRLKRFKNIKYTLGKHRAEDFKDQDLILRAAGVPKNSKFLKIAKKNKIPIEMDDSLFAKYCPCPIIGVTGTRGKTTTATLIYEILSSMKSSKDRFRARGRKVYLAGNVQGVATLPLIKKVKQNDLAVLELSSWQLQGWDEAGISPRIAVITNIYPDHLNYYKGNMKMYVNDKKAIYRYQSKDDFLILNQENKYSREFAREAGSKIIWFSRQDVSRHWQVKLVGEHNLENIAAAMAVAKVLNVSGIKKVIESFKGLEHRLELVREIDGVKYINDATSTTPIAAQKALAAFNQPIILIAGGSDKRLDFSDLARDIKKKCKAVVLLKGEGTERLKKYLSFIIYPSATSSWPSGHLSFIEVDDLRQAVKVAKNVAEAGDIVLFSPACTSFGMFVNEYDRGLKFKKVVESLA